LIGKKGKRKTNLAETIEFLVVSDGEHDVARVDASQLVVTCCISCEFQDLCRKILK